MTQNSTAHATETHATEAHSADATAHTDLPDPRPGLDAVTEIVIDLVRTVDTSDFEQPTPCTEFDVQALLDHITMVVRRSAAMGRGEHFSTVEQERVGESIDDYVAALQSAAEQQRAAWADPARLGAPIEAPWATLPGAALVATYTAELSTHGWDLATALDRPFTIPDELLHAAEFAIKQLPAEGREHPDIPFDPVVDPGPGASKLLVIAGWGGRQVA